MKLKDRLSKILFIETWNKINSKNQNQSHDFLESVLLLFTNGGGDHNKTHASVQKSSIATFINLDLEFFCTKWTCPTKSWTSFAERVQFNLFNITPQHCSLKKDKIIDKLEDIVKKCKNTLLQKKTYGDRALSLLSFHLLKVYFLWLKVESFIRGHVITKLMFFFRS